jgi:formamidopyrimidine-DNA glycosylase
MPELAEVEVGRRLAESVLRDRRLVSVWCDDDRIVFDRTPPDEVQAQLTGRTVVAVRRKGKQLWFELDRRPWPTFHFGMTGAFLANVARGPSPIQLHSGPRLAPDWPPRFTKICVTTDAGEELVMTNARRLGRIRTFEDPLGSPPLSDLGFDPWTEPQSRAAFAQRLNRRRGSLKSVLLDQSFAAGIGNWLADEILYQSRLDPRRSPGSLDDAEVGRLHRELHRVVRVAVEREGKNLPRTWLVHHRWSKADSARQAVRTARGEAVRYVTLAGRTTAFVPDRQR